MSPRPTLTINEVAERLAMSPKRFLGRRGALYRAGFPRPLPACGNLWSVRLVDAWIDAGGSFAVPRESVGPLQGLDAIVEDDRRALEERFITNP